MIYAINRHSLTPFWTPYWLKHVMESFTIFTSSAMVDYIIFYYFSQQRFEKVLGMTCIALDVQKQNLDKETEVRYCSCIKVLFFVWQGSEFKDFSRPNKEMKYFSRTLNGFKDFLRRLVKFKAFWRLYHSRNGILLL